MKEKKLELYFGALVKNVSEQVQEQFDYIDDTMIRFDSTQYSIAKLYVEGIITASEKSKANHRLMKEIVKYLKLRLAKKRKVKER